MFPIRRAWTTLLALTLSTIAAFGAETAPPPFTYTDINTVVPGHPELRYSDLLRQLVPDLRLNETIATGTAPTQPIPHVMGKPFVAHFDTTVSFASFETRTIQSEGANRLLILTAVGLRTNPDDPVLLLAFSDDASPKLLDVMDVSMGDTVTIGQPFRIGAHDQAIVTSSDYANEGQTQSADAVLFMRNGKFSSVGGFFRTGTLLCGFERTQTLDLTTQKPLAAAPYDDIKVTINDIGRPLKDGCAQPLGLAPYADQYSALYQWNAATGFFDGDTAEIDKLKDLNDTRQ
ncbi:MAG: hypothetical protein JWP26_4424 [Devosia sp.]|uniref:hypothetical protein n=1 Tax=Devosia sp. TaxID=1871048 RepID=UPI00260E84B0|nr:hypothetical protein [Devosia sp.]MDB5537130.1 hypothetical protein [Devosia sp.]MDB5589454.1 hypothetical protein [Devosia sp.]